MVEKGEPTASRRPRADAERNRARLLAAAKTIFAEKGTAASMDEIARAAAVGAGTLYRHFPTRDAVVSAVYRNETEQLVAAATHLAETQPPVAALREWLLLFVDYLAAKRGMNEVLNAVVAGTLDLYAASGAEVRRTVAYLSDRAVASGEIRMMVEPLDLLRALAGVVTARAESSRSAKQLVDILIAGIRTCNEIT